MRHVAWLLGGLLSITGATDEAHAGDARGPFELRDAHVLAQPRLTLPAVGPWTLGPGHTLLRVGILWGNSFAWAQDVPGEAPQVRRYLIDGEALTLDVTLAHGLRDGLDVSVRVPVQWRGGGAMDAFIDAFHRALAFAGVNDGDRPAFRRDAFRVEGRTTDGRAFTWNAARGAGLGDVELAARWRLSAASHVGWTSALVARVSLPTGTRPFDGNGFAAGAQVVASRPLGARADLFVGLGATAGGSRRVRGVGYERRRARAFATLERRLGARVSLVIGTDAATRLARDIDGFPGRHWTAHAGAWIDTGRCSRLAVALVENIAAQAATADFALHVGVELRR